MNIALGTIALFAFGLLIVGFWREDPVVWFMDTVLWLIESYLLFEQAVNASFSNTYMPTAFTLIGVGFTLLSIYKAIAAIIAILNKRRASLPHMLTYDEEKEANRRRIYDLTRQR